MSNQPAVGPAVMLPGDRQSWTPANTEEAPPWKPEQGPMWTQQGPLPGERLKGTGEDACGPASPGLPSQAFPELRKVPLSQVLGHPEQGPQSHCETRAGGSQAGPPDRVVSSACCPPKAAQTHCLTRGSMRSCLIVWRSALPLPIWPWDPYLNKIHVTTPIEYMFPGILLGSLHDQVTR